MTSKEESYFGSIFAPYLFTKVWKPLPKFGKVWFNLSLHQLHHFRSVLLQILNPLIGK